MTRKKTTKNLKNNSLTKRIVEIRFFFLCVWLVLVELANISLGKYTCFSTINRRSRRKNNGKYNIIFVGENNI